MAVTNLNVTQTDIVSGGKIYAVNENARWVEIETTVNAIIAALDGTYTIAGDKTFSGQVAFSTSFPTTPNTPPATDYQVANMKYVVDSIAAIDLTTLFGTRTREDSDSAAIAEDVTYKASVDGILVAWLDGTGNSKDWIRVYEHSSQATVEEENTADIVAYQKNGTSAGEYACLCVTVPVKKDDYIRIRTGNTDTAGTEAIIAVWTPFGTGSLVNQS